MHEFRVTPFARLDAGDDNRTHVDLREAFWRGVFGEWEVLVGANVVFWGVTESRHLVDIVNQTDFREDVDQEDKLGQPMLSVAWQRAWGRLTGLVLVGFREQPFPGPDGRPRLPLPVDTGAARFPEGRQDTDVALRYSHVVGDVDIGVYAFHGTSREPAFVVNEDDTALLPVYRTVAHVGLDVQFTRDAWLWKLEAIARRGEGDPFGAIVGGVEHTRFQVFGSAADVGFLAEYLYDERDVTAPPTAFDNDGFLGARLAVNDTQDSTLLVGAVIGRLFGNVSPDNLLHAFSNDSFVAVRLNVFF